MQASRDAIESPYAWARLAMSLLLMTTFCAMLIAERGLPPLWLVVVTLLGGVLASGGASVLNCYIDRDIDRLFEAADASRDARDPLSYEKADAAFHRRISAAARNPLLIATDPGVAADHSAMQIVMIQVRLAYSASCCWHLAESSRMIWPSSRVASVRAPASRRASSAGRCLSPAARPARRTVRCRGCTRRGARRRRPWPAECDE